MREAGAEKYIKGDLWQIMMKKRLMSLEARSLSILMICK